MQSKFLILSLLFILFMSGVCADTLYNTGDALNLWTGLTNFTTQEAVTGSNCTTEVYYPNNTVWLTGVPMIELSAGLYSNNSHTAQQPYGTYLYSVNCSPSYILAGSFTVNEAEHPDAIYKSMMFIAFGLLSLWLSFTLAVILSHPLRVVAWVYMLTALTSGMANGIVSPLHITGLHWIFYALIIIELILFIVDVFSSFKKK